MNRRSTLTAQSDASSDQGRGASLPMLQRSCACGTHSAGGGECHECSRQRLQRKSLSISRNDDASEVEADRVAASIASNSTPTPLRVSRMPDSSAGGEPAPPIVHDVLSAPGRSLDAHTRQFFESRFGQDFSAVRVHTDARAAESARTVHAHAYTVGSNVVFASGKYSPDTAQGQKLLAHELTHVTQQAGAMTGANRLSRDPDGTAAGGGRKTEAVLHQEYERACAGVRVLERLERDPPSPAEKVRRLERRVKRIPAVIKALQEAKKESAKAEREFYEQQIWPEFGQGYVLTNEADELARAQCELSKARWELEVFTRTGRLPGRLIRP